MFGLNCVMKPLRMVKFVAGVLAAVLVAMIAAPFVLSSFRNEEWSRIERLGQDVKASLESYRHTHGAYPDSLQALASLSLPQNGAIYKRVGSGYEFSFEGRWYDYRLSVSNNGDGWDSSLKAR
jgi:type II secretory pathway pseudopilin PulG